MEESGMPLQEEHTVPCLRFEPMVELPYLDLPIRRRWAMLGTGLLIGLLFLWSKGLTGWLLVAAGVAFAVAVLAYEVLQPGGLTLDQWVVLWWEYLQLPRYLAWQPDAAADKASPVAPTAGAQPDDLWRSRP
jgi:hypothetical protein